MEFTTSFEGHWLAILGTSMIAYHLGNVIWNLYFHPLAKFPGPFLARSTLLWRMWMTLTGRHHEILRKQHEKYGNVVRVSPNELSFCTVQSWSDIYGFPPPGGEQCIKSEFYDIFGNGFKTGCIGTERDPKVQSRKKRNLLAAFSPKALAAQEDIMHRCINAFVSKIGPESQRLPNGINMVEWFNMSSFDLFGEMAFGETFGCIASGKPHFWIDMILEHVREIVLMDNLRRFQILSVFSKWLLPSLLMSIRRKHTQYSRDKVAKRLASTATRQDFFTNIAEKVKSGQVPLEEMTAHASTLIIAGGETTATTLSAAMFYLLKDPRVTKKLTEEIRQRYSSYDEIDAVTAQQLPYLQAVINEALRHHPSGAHGFPRISPGLQVDGHWVPKGSEIYTCTWVASHNPEYFQDPDTFQPERWIDPDSKDVKEASQPFSLGFRACIGRSFAYMQMSLVLSKILFKYDVELVEKDMDWEKESKHFIMWAKAPYHIRAHDRLS
ncbi:putative cytochrome P450 [Xylaria bambusicola]|uniref:putative cytochrome P450 n=1 Tax=Xylaria bambusicola TaxID=326684 RepID=UPI002007422A|nr:putative cytochrome P450 [Xylaria bambusicola]KAI0516780.1 putative cytochrome P450 [Xylaria bambusicola]